MVPTVVLQLVPVLLLSPPLNKKKIENVSLCVYDCLRYEEHGQFRSYFQAKQWLLVKMLKDALRNYEP